MKETKVILILCDGMRPDALVKSGHPFFTELQNIGACDMAATTVNPSVTLPCHISLFLGVDPTKHGVLTNTYTPPEKPIKGLCEQLNSFGKKCAMFYDWEELRDVARPGSMQYSYLASGNHFGFKKTAEMCTDNAISFISEQKPDFAFLYMCLPDDIGHNFGWMTDEYMDSINICFDNIEKLCHTLPNEYTVIVTADHGGHDYIHDAGTPEDMLIPVIIKGEKFNKNKKLKNVNILDIAPTVAALLDVPPCGDWEGKNLL